MIRRLAHRLTHRHLTFAKPGVARVLACQRRGTHTPFDLQIEFDDGQVYEVRGVDMDGVREVAPIESAEAMRTWLATRCALYSISFWWRP